MSFPFGNMFGAVVEDVNVPEGTVYLLGMRYKPIPVGTGEPPRFKEEIDWDATARASAVITNIGEGKK
jgi:hypothetical protein